MEITKRIDRILTETKARRAWSGKLKKIDQLLMWMYDQDILNKGEKKKKDSLFHRYYRYYNDGDFPRGLKNATGNNLSANWGPARKGRTRKLINAEAVEEALENQLDEFIKKVLSKYMNSAMRSDFKIDQAIKEIDRVISIAEAYDVHGLTKYWKKDVKDPVVLKMISSLEKKYDKLDKDTGSTNTTIQYRRDGMMSDNTWTKSHMEQWKDIRIDMIEISSLLQNIKISLKKMKTLKLLSN